MAFADAYLEKQSLYPPFIIEFPSRDLFSIVVIPCFDEPDLISTLDSLKNCYKTKNPVEVITVINSASPNQQNIITKKEAEKWIEKNNSSHLYFKIIFLDNLPQKDAGVGLARKIGMDEATHRFNLLNNPHGVIVGYDADSKCDPNYLQEIENHFINNPSSNGCSIHFEHPTEGDEFDARTYEGIIQYELYLRYYRQALKYIIFPYAFHTIGSSFAVRASAYIRQGGMNKKKAGEDFYFLQKIIPLGNYSEINNTRVIPSPRPSHRVPFGTGAAIQKWNNLNSETYNTYQLKSFIEIGKLFKSINKFYNASNEIIELEKSRLNINLQNFLNSNKFNEAIEEINQNSSSLETFQKRFYTWFNAFRVLKCLNYLSENGFPHCPIEDSAEKLLSLIKPTEQAFLGPKDLLEIYRNLDKSH